MFNLSNMTPEEKIHFEIHCEENNGITYENKVINFPSKIWNDTTKNFDQFMAKIGIKVKYELCSKWGSKAHITRVFCPYCDDKKDFGRYAKSLGHFVSHLAKKHDNIWIMRYELTRVLEQIDDQRVESRFY